MSFYNTYFKYFAVLCGDLIGQRYVNSFHSIDNLVMNYWLHVHW